VRARAHAVHRAAPCFNPYKVIAQIIQLLLDPRLSRFANGDNANHRCDPDSDAQDRQDAAHFVSEQRD
jgi:hypothetical protein